MIESLFEIGKIQPAGDFLHEYIQDIGSGYKHVFKIVFNIDDPAQISYKKIDYEEFSEGHKIKYFYKKGGSQGPDRSPTSKITNLSKTFSKKILKSVNSFLNENKLLLSDADVLFLANLDQCLNEREEDILKDLKSFAGTGMEVLGIDESIDDRGILTLAFEKDGQMKALGEMEIFKNTISQQEHAAFKNYYYSKSRDEECRGSDKTCYICRESKTEVWGLVSTFKSYTIDKPGMVTGGFKQKDAWKNYPVRKKGTDRNAANLTFHS